MNCLTTRRHLQATPHQTSTEITQHLAGCESCRQFAARLLREEQLLAASIAVPVPEQLAERILLRTQMQTRRSFWAPALQLWQRWQHSSLQSLLARPLPLAMAATTLLTLGLSWQLLWVDADLNWNEVLLAHAASESEAEMAASGSTVAQAELQQAFKEYGLKTMSDLGKVRYLGRCLLPGGRGVHVVIDTPDLGQVTLILPPKGVKAHSQLARLENYSGQVIQINQASVGIMSQDQSNITALIQRVQQRVTGLG